MIFYGVMVDMMFFEKGKKQSCEIEKINPHFVM